ncbi:MAG: hypothetical protein P4M09_07030, partial [Devosia sp.]|nr:hypothetical protein [Devosia sp.]
GFEGFFRELSDMTAVGAPDPAAIATLAAQYDLPFAQPDWLPDVIARYGLTPVAHRAALPEPDCTVPDV